MAARRGLVAGVALALLAGCQGGDGGRAGGPSAPSSTSGTSTSIPTTAGTSTSIPTTAGTSTSGSPAPGTVVLRARRVVLPDPAVAADGLRLLVGSAPSYVVQRRGAVAVEVCPVDAGGAARRGPGGCARPGPDEALEVGGGSGIEGVEVRQPAGARGGAAPVEEVTLTYRPAGRAITLVVPRPAGACLADRCRATFELAPSGSGTFVLEAHPQGGRPELTLLSGPADRPGSRSLATVEGSSNLSIRASVEAGSTPQLVFQEGDPGGGAALAMELFWP